MDKLTLRDVDMKGKRVLMRVDFNVPLEGGEVKEDARIRAALPSIRYVLEQGAVLVLMSHLGRPKGGKGESLAPCAKRLGELLGREVKMAPDCVGEEVEKIVAGMKGGEVVMLENLRLHAGEEEPEKEEGFVEGLAKLGDVYVNDAFGTAHRNHASTARVAVFFPGRAAAGFLMEREVEMLGKLLEKPEKPFYAIVGGAKIGTKVGVLRQLLAKVDGLFIGGAMAYPFLRAQGRKMGECEGEEMARQVLEEVKRQGKACWLPEDLVVADAFREDAKKKIVEVEEGVEPGWQGMGIGPKTVKRWAERLQKAKTVFWNGPLSVFEMPRFSEGTFAIAKVLAGLDATVVVGGGDSIAAIEQSGLSEKFSHLSTGGGAALEFIEFGHLPGVDALSSK